MFHPYIETGQADTSVQILMTNPFQFRSDIDIPKIIMETTKIEAGLFHLRNTAC